MGIGEIFMILRSRLRSMMVSFTLLLEIHHMQLTQQFENSSSFENILLHGIMPKRRVVMPTPSAMLQYS